MNDRSQHPDHALQHAIEKLCANSGTIHVRDADELVLHLVARHDVPASLIDAIREIYARQPARDTDDQKWAA